MSLLSSYVERWGADYMVSGSRISLASVVHAWKEGSSPESIREDFPALTLEQIYGAITFYLAHQTEIDSYLATLTLEFEERRIEEAARYPEIAAKLETAREETHK